MIGGALVDRLLERGDEVVGLARSDAAAAELEARGARVVRGEGYDVDALARGMDGLRARVQRRRRQRAVRGGPAPDGAPERGRAAAAVRAAARAGMTRLVHTSSAATIGEAPGTVGTEHTVHRGWYLSTYERTKTEGERAALAAAREVGQDLVLVNPSSVQGPGRAGGTGRFMLAFLDGRLKVFVPTVVSLVDIDDCVTGHLLAGERGAAGERYLLNGMTLTIDQALALAAEVGGRRTPAAAGPAARGHDRRRRCVERGFRLAGRHPPVCREMVRTLLHGHRYDGSRAERELGLRYTEPRETIRKTVAWARAEGLIG